MIVGVMSASDAFLIGTFIVLTCLCVLLVLSVAVSHARANRNMEWRPIGESLQIANITLIRTTNTAHPEIATVRYQVEFTEDARVTYTADDGLDARIVVGSMVSGDVRLLTHSVRRLKIA